MSAVRISLALVDLAMRKAKISFAIFFLFTLSFFVVPTPAYASVIDDIFNGVKNTVQGGADKVSDILNGNPDSGLSIESAIQHAPEGDVNKNGQIDTGDTVRFVFKISNSTDQEYQWATLRTNIDRKMINYIRNEFGTLNLIDDAKTLIIPHIHLLPKQQLVFRFDADINYSTMKDIAISSEPELLSKENKSLVKVVKKHVVAKKITESQIRSIQKKNTYEFNAKKP